MTTQNRGDVKSTPKGKRKADDMSTNEGIAAIHLNLNRGQLSLEQKVDNIAAALEQVSQTLGTVAQMVQTLNG